MHKILFFSMIAMLTSCVSRNIINHGNREFELLYTHFQGPKWKIVIQVNDTDALVIPANRIVSVDILSTPPQHYTGGELIGFIEVHGDKTVTISLNVKDVHATRGHMLNTVNGDYKK